MANLKDSPKFQVYDNFFTPSWVWGKITQLIPKDKIIWEACMLNATHSKSIEIWRDFGYQVVGDTSWDILTSEIPECDIIITNIPFETSIKQAVLKRLIEIDKPFIIIMNSMNVFSNYFQEIMNLSYTQLITPKGKLHYCKDGETEKRNTSFYSLFVAYKMNLRNDQLFV